ncbi:MAG: hypothetical protein NVSMB60_07060 [Mycobacterium sp.]
MAAYFDPYSVLGVSRTARSAEITRAFRAKLRVLHPDTGATARDDAELQRVLTAYHFLRDRGDLADDFADENGAADPADPPSPPLRSGPSTPTTSPEHAEPRHIPVTYRREGGPTTQPVRPLWAGPVRRHWR